MHKILQFTLVFILSSTFLANIGLNQSDGTDKRNIDLEKQAKQFKKFVNSQDEETSNRILSLQIAALESITLLRGSDTQTEDSELMVDELTKIESAISNLNSSNDLNYELSYLEENLKLIQSELSNVPAKAIDISSLDCNEVTRSLMKNNNLTLFYDPLAKSGSIKATVSIKPSIDETLLELSIQVSNKNARDMLGSLGHNTQMIFESENGNLIKCTSKNRSHGSWNDDNMSVDYTATFVMPYTCQYFDAVYKVKLIWSNGINEYMITDAKPINDFLACECNKS